VAVDYLTVTFPGGSVNELASEVAALVGVREWHVREVGLNGYAESIDVGGYALIAHGGDAQRGTIMMQLNGKGSQRVARFAPFTKWCEEREGRITRLDIAGDDHAGETLTVDSAMQAWAAGEFKMSAGGRQPNAQHISDCGSGKGCTFYVGARQSGKLCRVYNKGQQLGDPASGWTRGEVEWLAKDRVIPWEAVRNPMPYLAGAYPYFSKFALAAVQLRTFKSSQKISFEVGERWARMACGKWINALLQRAHGDIGAVITALRRNGLPARLAPFRGHALAIA
jgi:phage replication initiation protein